MYMSGVIMFTAGLLIVTGCASMKNAPPTTAADVSHDKALIVLSFDGCPNSPEVLRAAHEAANTLGTGWTVHRIDIESLPPDDIRRGYGSPTILWNEHDIFGAPIPSSPVMSCRYYPDGLPTATTIAHAIRSE